MLVAYYRQRGRNNGEPNDYQRVGIRHSLVERIDSIMIPSKDKSLLRRFGLNKLMRDVRFEAYFRAPPARRYLPPPFADETMTLYLILKPGTQIIFGEAMRQPQFQNSTDIRDRIVRYLDTPHLEYYVTCQPGSVFPVSFVVKHFQRKNTFSLPVIETFGWRVHNRAQPVSMTAAVVQQTRPGSVIREPPIIRLLDNRRGSVLLAKRLQEADIRAHAILSENEQRYALIGYFRPRHARTRLVLSATSLVEVEVHAPFPWESDSEYLVYTLKAEDGEACEMTRLLDPNLYYKVVVVGLTDMLNEDEFTLMEYDPGNGFSGTGVTLFFSDAILNEPPRPDGTVRGTGRLPDLIPAGFDE